MHHGARTARRGSRTAAAQRGDDLPPTVKRGESLESLLVLARLARSGCFFAIARAKATWAKELPVGRQSLRAYATAQQKAGWPAVPLPPHRDSSQSGCHYHHPTDQPDARGPNRRPRERGAHRPRAQRTIGGRGDACLARLHQEEEEEAAEASAGGGGRGGQRRGNGAGRGSRGGGGGADG